MHHFQKKELKREKSSAFRKSKAISLEDNRLENTLQLKLNNKNASNQSTIHLKDNRTNKITNSTSPIQAVFIDGSGGKVMSSAQVQAYTTGKGLSSAMQGEIARRQGHTQRYIIDNTISGLKSGSITLAPPSSSSSTTWSSRTSAGYVNPSHSAVSVRPLFRDAAMSPIPSSIADDSKEEWDHLSDPSRRFRTHTPTHTSAPVIVKGHGNTVMGHGPVDAVDHWNANGHLRSRRANLAYNKQDSIYHGLEEKHASAASGAATTSHYRPPSPSIGSHESHWDTTHPEYDERTKWHPRNVERRRKNNIATARSVTGGVGALGGAAIGAYYGSALGFPGMMFGGIAGGLLGWYGGSSAGEHVARDVL